MANDNPSKPGPEVIRINTGDEIRVNADESQVELWMAGNYAPAWFRDAKTQAEIDGDVDDDDMVKPREIVFAVCAIESYLVEWVRDEVLKSNYRQLKKYFPAPRNGRYSSIVVRWKGVIERLVADRAIPGKPDFDNQRYWKDFEKLVRFRNGLVHGRASRPDSNAILDEDERAGPTVHDLVAMDQGWAVRVVAEVIKRLHTAVGTTPPTWLNV